MDEQWLQEMQSKMTDYQWAAPELSWEELDQALTANNPGLSRLPWLRRMAAAAVLLLIAGVGYWGLFNHTEPKQITIVSIREADGNKDYRSICHDTVINQGLSHMTSHPASLASMKSSNKPRKREVPLPESETVTPVSMTNPDSLYITVNEDEALSRPNEESGSRLKEQTPLTPFYPTDLHQRKHMDSRLTAKVYMSNAMIGNQTESSHVKREDITNIGNPVQTVQIDQHVMHRQPVHFGLSLRYRLHDRWNLESGLLYTCLSSDITTTEGGVTTVTEQRLNYLGLPLNVSYELWKSSQLSFYVTAGNTIEKRLDSSSWQFSVNGAAGAEYKLTDFFSLYAEPGLGYYFKDYSTTLTIYQDHPLNFNLSIGLRFNLK